MTSEKAIPVYLTVKQFCSKHPWPSESAMRAIVLDSKSNGFHSAIKRVKRRVLIDESEFFASIERLQNQKNKNTVD